MASVVGAIPAVSAASAAASRWVKNSSSSRSSSSSFAVFSERRAIGSDMWVLKGCSLSMQSRVSMVPRSFGAAGRIRASSAEAKVTEPVEPTPAAEAKVTKQAASGDAGKSTLDIVCEVISEQLAVALDELEPDTKFVDLGADSLDTVEIMMSLEERFEITIEEDGTEKIATVKDAADLIDMVKAAK